VVGRQSLSNHTAGFIALPTREKLDTGGRGVEWGQATATAGAAGGVEDDTVLCRWGGGIQFPPFHGSTRKLKRSQRVSGLRLTEYCTQSLVRQQLVPESMYVVCIPPKVCNASRSRSSLHRIDGVEADVAATVDGMGGNEATGHLPCLANVGGLEVSLRLARLASGRLWGVHSDVITVSSRT
jgi:hypothetical protein